MSTADYDVIVIGSGAGGGTLVRHLAPSGKRILLLERGDWLPREPHNWDAARRLRRQPLRLRGHLVRRQRASRSSRRSTTSSAARRSSTAPRSTACAREDFGELRHHDGISPAWPIGYDEMEPYYTQAEQLYQVHGARGEDPDRAAGERAVPVPGGLARAAHPAARRRPRGRRPPPVPRALRRHARRARHALQHVRALRRPATASRAWCTRSPTPRCSPCGRRSSIRTSRCSRTPRRCAWRPTTAGRAVTGRRRRARRRAGDLHRRHRRRLLRRGEQREAAARLGQRRAPARAGQRLRPGRAQLHVPQQPGGAGALEGAEPDRLPEDARAQRLLLRGPRCRLPAGQHPDGRQVAAPRCTAARSRCRRSSRRSGRSTRSPSTRSTSGSRPRTCRVPDNRVTREPRRRREARSYTPTNDEPKERLCTSSSRCSARSACMRTTSCRATRT